MRPKGSSSAAEEQLCYDSCNSEHLSEQRNQSLILSSSQQSSSDDNLDMIDTLMTWENDDGMSILESAFFILFEAADDRFVLNLLNQIPNISEYLETPNGDGKLPLFRVLHLFQD